jgi:membrane protein implicated in regulation of membrane protease activity
MGRLIYWAIVSVIISLVATLFMGGGPFAAAAIHDMDLTFGFAAWVVAVLILAWLFWKIARKYRDYRAIYGQQTGYPPHHGGHP